MLIRLTAGAGPPACRAGAAPRFSGLKLEGGPTAHEGRLLALTGQNGSLGSVCLRGAFHSWPGDGDITGAAGRAARVACSQLGFPGGAAARTGMFFGNTSLPIAARLYSCSGTEARLEQCVGSGTITASLDPSQTWHLQECSRSDDLGVWCRGEAWACAWQGGSEALAASLLAPGCSWLGQLQQGSNKRSSMQVCTAARRTSNPPLLPDPAPSRPASICCRPASYPAPPAPASRRQPHCDGGTPGGRLHGQGWPAAGPGGGRAGWALGHAAPGRCHLAGLGPLAQGRRPGGRAPRGGGGVPPAGLYWRGGAGRHLWRPHPERVACRARCTPG